MYMTPSKYMNKFGGPRQVITVNNWESNDDAFTISQL